MKNKSIYLYKTTKGPKNLQFDYGKIVEKTDMGFKLKGQNRLLLSPSRMLKLVNDVKLFGIPEKKLIEKREIGSRLMMYIQSLFAIKSEQISDANPLIGDYPYLDAFFSGVKNPKTAFKPVILDVEKFITNGYICGFVDVLMKLDKRFYVVEVKTREDLKERKTDFFQLRCYMWMLGISGVLLMINSKGEYKEIRMNKMDKRGLKEIKLLLKGLKMFDVEYTINNQMEIA